MIIELTELQRDAIAETLNIGMGRSAAALSQMVDDKVSLSAPVVDFIALKTLLSNIAADKTHQMIGIEQDFCGSFQGKEFLLFDKSCSLDLVRVLIKEDVPLDFLTDFEQEAFLEIGNIILNACTGSIANLLKDQIEISLPTFRAGNAAEVLDVNEDDIDEHCVVLYLLIKFALEKLQAEGHIVFLMEIESVEQFKRKIDELIGTMGL